MLGASPDSVESHQRWAAKINLPFPLLSDRDHKIAEKYGVWKQRMLYGNSFLGIERSTFLIDGNGVIRKAWRKVKADENAELVLGELGGSGVPA